jgi:hypothetical protein
MARAYAQIHQRIWADPEWRALDGDAQLLYLLLMSQPSLDLAGVLPLQTRRWASCVADWTAPAIDMALTRLADARFVVVDQDTEEVLIRSFIRNDGGYKTPGVLKSALKSAEAVQSPAIRSALFIELGRLPRLEGKTAAEGEASIKATRAALEPIGDPFPDPIRDGIERNPSGMPSQEPIPDPIVDLSVSVSVPRSSHLGNSAAKSGGASHVSSGPGSTPPRFPDHCTTHADVAVPGKCGDCADARKARAAEPALPDYRLRVVPPLCGECDERWIETPDGWAKCPRCYPQEVSA